MDGGGATANPWTWASLDYQGLGIYITVNWNTSTRALTGATVSRDTGCQYHNVIIGDPTSGQQKTLAAPADGHGPTSYTAAQMAKQGLSSIDDVTALQITASP